jgi:hypothetical protein
MSEPTTTTPRIIRCHWRDYHATVCKPLRHYRRAPMPVTRWVRLWPIPLLRRELLGLIDIHDPWCHTNRAGRTYRPRVLA